MKQISLPQNLEVQESKDNKNRAQIIIEPFYPGYGNTVGNALRRVLLSSLTGAAVVAVKIKGVHHEFSTIEYIKEDVVDILLNLKQLRLKMDPEMEMSTIELKASGKKVVTGKDIKTSNGIEVCNPELEIATLTDKKASLEMKIWVNTGKGYVLVDEHPEMDLEVDTIVVDSSYTPIENVALNVENVRVGDRIDFDKMTLDIETDGSMTPKESVIKSTEILMKQLEFILNPELGKQQVEAEDEESEDDNEKTNKTKKKTTKSKEKEDK